MGGDVWKSIMTADTVPAFRTCLQISNDQGKGLQITVVTLGSEERDESKVALDDPVRLGPACRSAL